MGLKFITISEYILNNNENTYYIIPAGQFHNYQIMEMLVYVLKCNHTINIDIAFIRHTKPMMFKSVNYDICATDIER